eukprot:11227940-Lingulodinium_polyedra.AAC.1
MAPPAGPYDAVGSEEPAAGPQCWPCWLPSRPTLSFAPFTKCWNGPCCRWRARGVCLFSHVVEGEQPDLGGTCGGGVHAAGLKQVEAAIAALREEVRRVLALSSVVAGIDNRIKVIEEQFELLSGGAGRATSSGRVE